MCCLAQLLRCACTIKPAVPRIVAGVLCGAAASGQFEWTPDNVAKSLLCMVMSGPLLTGYTQASAPLIA